MGYGADRGTFTFYFLSVLFDFLTTELQSTYLCWKIKIQKNKAYKYRLPCKIEINLSSLYFVLRLP